MFNRRKLLKDVLKISAGVTLSRSVLSLAQADSATPLSLGKGKTVSIPANFIGLWI